MTAPARPGAPADPTAPADPAGPAPLDTPAERYRMLRLIRGFEELALGLVKAGAIPGGIHPYIGQEAVAVGVCSALGPTDRLASTHRGHGHVLARGTAPHRLLAELLGRVGGANGGRGGSMHAADFSLGILGANGMVGAGAPIAVGAAWAAATGPGRAPAGRIPVAVAFFGDGALNQGVLLESLNLAAMWRLPVLFVCEDNGYATTLPAAPLDPATVAELDRSVAEQLAAAEEFALASDHPDPAGALDHLYADGLRPRAGAAS
ncbi:thiamine pyrophosphate-dependent enzyme [Kitasatospora sp. NPDC056783]|uniref:thiamine pyrophosphate-dependent enzyme n=1 Tax=Kitasatospora sp. NPDC056783 TaxID=3345943 RepID=UPI0036C1241C